MSLHFCESRFRREDEELPVAQPPILQMRSDPASTRQEQGTYSRAQGYAVTACWSHAALRGALLPLGIDGQRFNLRAEERSQRL